MYAPYSRTQEALRGLGATFRDISLRRAEQEREKASHLARMATLDIKKADVAGRQEIGKLQALSQMEERKASGLHRAAMLEESKRRSGYAETTAGYQKSRLGLERKKLDLEKHLSEKTTLEDNTRSYLEKNKVQKEEIDETIGKMTEVVGEAAMKAVVPRRNLLATKDFLGIKLSEGSEAIRANRDRVKAESDARTKYEKDTDAVIKYKNAISNLNVRTILTKEDVEEVINDAGVDVETVPTMREFLNAMANGKKITVEDKEALLKSLTEARDYRLDEMFGYEVQLYLKPKHYDESGNIRKGVKAIDSETGIAREWDGRRWRIMQE